MENPVIGANRHRLQNGEAVLPKRYCVRTFLVKPILIKFKGNACGLQYKKYLKSQKGKEGLGGVTKKSLPKTTKARAVHRSEIAPLPVYQAPARMSINNLLN